MDGPNTASLGKFESHFFIKIFHRPSEGHGVKGRQPMFLFEFPDGGDQSLADPLLLKIRMDRQLQNFPIVPLRSELGSDEGESDGMIISHRRPTVVVGGP